MVFDIISCDRLTNHDTYPLQESVTATTMSSTSVLLWSQQLRVSHLVFVIGNMCSSPKDEHQIGLVLQTQDLRVDQKKEPCIRVNTRELDRELCTGLSTLYTKTSWSMLTTSSLP